MAVGSEFVVAASYVLDESVTSDHDRCGAIGFESSHGSESGFKSPVITFDPVVRELLGVVKRVRDHFLDHGFQRLSKISDDLVWFAVSGQGFGEERTGCGNVAAR